MSFKKVAFLILGTFNAGAKRKNKNYFDARLNIGLIAVKQELEQNLKIKIEFCNPATAYKHDLVLISFTSNYDILSFARAVGKYKHWKKRTFTTIGGGFGMQNPYHIRQYLDYAYFGRCEDEIHKIIGTEFQYDSKALMRIKEKGLHEVEFRQATRMLTIRGIKSGGRRTFDYVEELQGCPNKCMYCQYTYVRKHKGRSDFVLETNNNPISVEIEWMDIKLVPPKIPRITTAIDGISQRVRYSYQRRLSDDDVKNFIIELSHITECSGVILTLYNILGMGETREEWVKFVEMMRGIEPKMKKKIVLLFHNTRFRPSPMTPSAYQGVDLFSDKMLAGLTTTSHKGSMNRFFSLPKFYMAFRSRMESYIGYLADLCVIRGCEENERIFNLIAYNSKFYNLPKAEQFRYIYNKYDLTSIVREYSLDEKLPTWFLSTYIRKEVMDKLTNKLRHRLTLDYVR